MWDSLRPRMEALKLDPRRVENVLGAGTPDVNYIDGWMELKQLPAWPARPDTIVALPKLRDRKEQVAFLTRRWMNGGQAWLMLRVKREWLLFSGYDVRAVRDGLTYQQLVQVACWHCPGIGGWDKDRLRRLRGFLVGQPFALPDQAKYCRLRAGFSIEGAAGELGWDVERVLAGERGEMPFVNDLIDAWCA